MLGDAAGFAGDDVGVADGIEQGGLAVIHVAHDGDDRRAGFEIGLGVVEIQLEFLFLDWRRSAGVALAFLGFEPKAVFGAELLGRRLVNGLVNIGEHAELHQIGDQLERLAFDSLG